MGGKKIPQKAETEKKNYKIRPGFIRAFQVRGKIQPGREKVIFRALRRMHNEHSEFSIGTDGKKGGGNRRSKTINQST